MTKTKKQVDMAARFAKVQAEIRNHPAKYAKYKTQGERVKKAYSALYKKKSKK